MAQQKWLHKLLGLDYTIEYKKGRENIEADALSRVPKRELQCSVLSGLVPTWMRDIAETYEGDSVA